MAGNVQVPKISGTAQHADQAARRHFDGFDGFDGFNTFAKAKDQKPTKNDHPLCILELDDGCSLLDGGVGGGRVDDNGSARTHRSSAGCLLGRTQQLPWQVRSVVGKNAQDHDSPCTVHAFSRGQCPVIKRHERNH